MSDMVMAARRGSNPDYLLVMTLAEGIHAYGQEACHLQCRASLTDKRQGKYSIWRMA